MDNFLPRSHLLHKMEIMTRSDIVTEACKDRREIGARYCVDEVLWS